MTMYLFYMCIGHLKVCLVLRKESGEMESENVNMESRGNDGKVKFVGLKKCVR